MIRNVSTFPRASSKTGGKGPSTPLSFMDGDCDFIQDTIYSRPLVCISPIRCVINHVPAKSDPRRPCVKYEGIRVPAHKVLADAHHEGELRRV